MPDLRKELDDLAKADHDIEEAERRIAHQVALIDKLSKDRHDTREAEKFLANLREALQAWRKHRALIVEIIERERGRAS